jgi:ABC-type cobalamin/Fe3+-siderophores transport system ATPase subunit
MAWLELVDVSVALGKRDVVHGVSAEVGAGDLVVVVGPNGAGKTTLLRAMAGLVPIRAGAVRVMGHDPARAPRRAIARELAYLPQHYDSRSRSPSRRWCCSAATRSSAGAGSRARPTSHRAAMWGR